MTGKGHIGSRYLDDLKFTENSREISEICVRIVNTKDVKDLYETANIRTVGDRVWGVKKVKVGDITEATANFIGSETRQ